MPSDRSLNVLDRFRSEYEGATDDHDWTIYRHAALPNERLRSAAPESDTVYWIALAERLVRKGHRVGWMLDGVDGAFNVAIVRQCYHEAFGESISELQIMAHTKHFENGEPKDGVGGSDDDENDENDGEENGDGDENGDENGEEDTNDE